MDTLYNKLSEKISDLILAVIALGLLVVSVEYVQVLTNNPDTLKNPEFWKRIALTSLVTAFTAYKFVAYSAYFCNPSNCQRLAGLSEWRIVVLFLLDLVEVTLVAWLYAVMLIGQLTSIGDEIISTDIELGATTIPFLFLFLALWHLTVLLWYVVAQGDWSDRGLHAGFAAAYLLAVLVLVSIDTARFGALADWLAIGFFALCVGLIYRLKAIPDIRAASTAASTIR